MIKITPYSNAALQQQFDTLQRKAKDGIIVDYEVYVDREQIVPRTSNLSHFYAFREFLTSHTESIEVWCYKGKSRRYDKYAFEFPKVKSVETLLEERSEEMRKKFEQEWHQRQLERELKDYKEKCKELKDDKKDLKRQLAQVQSEGKNLNILNGLMDTIKQSGFIKPSASELNGIPVQPLIEKLSEMQKEMGEESFQYFLGTAFMLGQHPKIIPEVRKLIEKSTKTKQ